MQTRGERAMENRQPLPRSATNSSPSYRQRNAARMTPSEAMKAVHRMLVAYPQFRCPEETAMALAETLCAFPLEVATAACSPVHGVPRTQKDFPPSTGHVA